jgi:hypothetical protein
LHFVAYDVCKEGGWEIDVSRWSKETARANWFTTRETTSRSRGPARCLCQKIAVKNMLNLKASEVNIASYIICLFLGGGRPYASLALDDGVCDFLFSATSLVF